MLTFLAGNVPMHGAVAPRNVPSALFCLRLGAVWYTRRRTAGANVLK